MFVNRTDISIEWGDCDPAGIVFFPRYLAYFDACTMKLFAAAGFAKAALLRDYEILGFPVVQIRAEFRAPSSFGDTVTIESRIPRWGRSSFDVQHRLLRGEELAVECFETRVWASGDPHDPSKLKSKPIPREVIGRFLGEAN